MTRNRGSYAAAPGLVRLTGRIS